MEVYILDSLLRRDTVVDVFESLIWTERFAEIGDFELSIYSSPTNRARFVTGVRLAMNESNRVMTIETVEDITDDQGRAMLKIKGRSLEQVFEDRTILGTAGPYNLKPIALLFGTPIDVMTQMFNICCVTGELHPHDPLPFLVEGTLYLPDNIPAPDDELVLEQEATQLYDALTDMGGIYDLGFRLYRDPVDVNGGKLYFDVYQGSDRTTLQTVLPPVVFSPELESMQNVKQLESIEKTKNVAYVFFTREVDGPVEGEKITEVFYELVYAENIDPDVGGFDRRSVYVKVDSIPEEVTDIPAYLIRKGKDELAKARPFALLDGEITQYGPFKYGRDYNLGDLVTMQTPDGANNSMRVTEQIFVQDGEGERSYPTLILYKFIDPDSWLSWNYNKQWSEMGDTEYWNTQ